MAAKKKAAAKRPAGRPEEPLILDGSWKDAIKRAMSKGKPPAEPKPKKKRRPLE
ncbi:MAG: hypothetical protein JWN44_7260 [Myxococcales bacterium]|nr:hypothetical protein [Myxococcales bacterium]